MLFAPLVSNQSTILAILIFLSVNLELDGLRTYRVTQLRENLPLKSSLFQWGAAKDLAEKIGSSEANSKSVKSKEQVVLKYFEHWNAREMDLATNLFSDDCTYEDTLYPEKFQGQSDVKFHLLRVADSLPRKFKFVVDEITPTSSKEGIVGVQWHVENGDQGPLPFTRGASIYKVNEDFKIYYGFDVPEPTVKTGGSSLALLKAASGIIEEPRKAIALGAWLFYCWFLFISNVAPGPNALQLDPATWQEVKDLSLNFWLVLPIVSPSSAPFVHPGLEGIFNMVLAWSALFIGFVSDGDLKDTEEGEGRKSMVPTLLAMQFLTNAILLPYLFSRKVPVEEEDFLVRGADEGPLALAAGEAKALPVVLAAVFTTSLVWVFLGRGEAFPDLSSRLSTLADLLSSDRLGFSFCVDLLYFFAFQGWLVDDDVRRRDWGAVSSVERESLVKAAKRVPFFGLAYYFFKRPALTV
jgi:hypothetical protein